MITLIEDTRNIIGKHNKKNIYFQGLGINVIRSKLPCGDYTRMDNMSICIDTKNSLQESVGNICGKEHDRFRRELQLAQNNGIKLIILIEEQGITCVEDVSNWINPRLWIMKNSDEVIGFYRNGKPRYKKIQRYPRATKGETLAKAMITLSERYGCEFQFVNPDDSGKRILELLGVNINV